MAQNKKKTKLLNDNTVIIGCGKLGASIANQKWKKGKSVIVIDDNKDSFLRLDRDFSGQTLIANATDIEKLEEAGTDHANEIVITTGDDNINIFLAQYFSTYYSPNVQIYIRLDDVNLGALIQNIPNVFPIYPLELSLGKYKLYKEKGAKR